MADENDSDPGGEGKAPLSGGAKIEPAGWRTTLQFGLDYSNNRLPIKLPALRRFLGNLDLCRRELEQDRLAGSITAIVAVERLLADLEADDRSGRRAIFRSLSTALGDLYNGREPPTWLRPRDKKSRGIDAAEVWIMRTQAAFIMGHLMSGEMNKWEASTKVAKTLNKSGIRCNNKTVSGWRTQLMEGPEGGSPPAFAINYWKDLHANPNPLGRPPKTEADRKRILNLLSLTLRQNGFIDRK
jgi:hypothetical protein